MGREKEGSDSKERFPGRSVLGKEREEKEWRRKREKERL